MARGRGANPGRPVVRRPVTLVERWDMNDAYAQNAHVTHDSEFMRIDPTPFPEPNPGPDPSPQPSPDPNPFPPEPFPPPIPPQPVKPPIPQLVVMVPGHLCVASNRFRSQLDMTRGIASWAVLNFRRE